MSIFGPKVPEPVAPAKLPSRASFISRGQGFGIRPQFKKKPTPVAGTSSSTLVAKPSLIGS